jgi:hypothetical protein
MTLMTAALAALAIPHAHAAWPTPPAEGWSMVQQSPLIQCTRDAAGLPWCYAQREESVPYARVVAVIKDLEAYPKVFGHIDQVRRLDADSAWIHVDYPSPLSDRDYIAGFALAQSSVVPGADPTGALSAFHLRFQATTHASAPAASESVVRLPRVAGGYDAWDLGGGKTRLRYTWETEIGGDVPAWVNDRARLQHGDEVVNGIVDAARR